MCSYTFKYLVERDLNDFTLSVNHSILYEYYTTAMYTAFKDDPYIDMPLCDKTLHDGLIMVIINNEDNGVIGAVAISRLADMITTCHIHSLFIQEKMRGKGYSKILLQELLNKKLPYGLKSINALRIDADLWNTAMNKTINATGFTEFYRSSDDPDKSNETVIAYRKAYDESNKDEVTYTMIEEALTWNWKKYAFDDTLGVINLMRLALSKVCK
jgi:N-acetylglutamate synthase-like GNAT family acetyltransferase